MKMRRMMTGLVMALLLTACTSDSGTEDTATEDRADSDGASNMMDDQESLDMDAEMMDAEMMDEADSSGQRLIGEKVIRTVNLEYETLDFERTDAHIQETVSNHDAFVEYSYESSYSPSQGASRQYRVIDYTLRVPTERLNAFLNELEGLEAYKISEQMGTEDVTQFYRDTEARIRVLDNKEERLNELLEQAETIEEIIQIENSLSDTIAEREMHQSQLDYYDDLIDYTVVQLTVTERARIANERGEGVPFFRRMRDAFADSMYAFYYILQDIVIFLVYAVPYIILIILITGIIWFTSKKVKNRRK